MKVGTCNRNCLEAREINCVCSCHGRNHGVHLRHSVRELERLIDSGAEPQDQVDRTGAQLVLQLLKRRREGLSATVSVVRLGSSLGEKRALEPPRCRVCGQPMALMDGEQQRSYCYRHDQVFLGKERVCDQAGARRRKDSPAPPHAWLRSAALSNCTV